MIANKSYSDFEQLDREIKHQGLGQSFLLPKRLGMCTNQEIYSEMETYLNQVLSREEIVNKMFFIKFIAEETKSGYERKDSIDSDYDRTQSFNDEPRIPNFNSTNYQQRFVMSDEFN